MKVYYSQIPLHLGELYQSSVSTGSRICISNILDSDFTHPILPCFTSNARAILSIAESASDHFEAPENFARVPKTLRSHKVIESIFKKHGLSCTFDLYVNTSEFVGWGIGSSTADLINAVQTAYQHLGLPVETEQLNCYLRTFEKASDPLHYKSTVIFDTVERRVIHRLQVKLPSALLLIPVGTDISGIDTDSISFPNKKISDIYRELACLVEASDKVALPNCKDISNIATRSIEEAHKYMHFPSFSIIRSIADDFGVGITGTHSGSLLALRLSGADLSDYDMHNAIAKQLSERMKGVMVYAAKTI